MQTQTIRGAPPLCMGVLQALHHYHHTTFKWQGIVKNSIEEEKPTPLCNDVGKTLHCECRDSCNGREELKGEHALHGRRTGSTR
eukprot:1142302-Pelagomonas_calceolata.AAC.14